MGVGNEPMASFARGHPGVESAGIEGLGSRLGAESAGIEGLWSDPDGWLGRA